MCSVALAVVIVLTIVFLLILLIVWANRPDPYLIDYDAPGVDITSEGPDDDYTEAYYEFGGDEP
ncbi:MAG: hypothetical protein IJ893_02665 [Bacteroidales bacterium]|nr:hypothetical protein [Bacteroidales bacterium]